MTGQHPGRAGGTPNGTPNGTQGYGETADLLVTQYESRTFADVHRGVLPLLPAAPARALDIGAGTGRDAAALAALGHTVLAVEPTPAMRAHGQDRAHEAADQAGRADDSDGLGTDFGRSPEGGLALND